MMFTEITLLEAGSISEHLAIGVVTQTLDIFLTITNAAFIRGLTRVWCR